MVSRVGVLALQGDSAEHRACLRALGQEPVAVRAPRDLAGISHLVIPGGESTTLHRLLDRFGLIEPILASHRARSLQLFGTCAGAILLGRADPEPPPRLGLLDLRVRRNAYGRQVDSFTRTVELPARGRALRGLFIRAPRFEAGGEGLEVLARIERDAVLVAGPGVLAASFHPELLGDPELHAWFLEEDWWARAERRRMVSS